MMVMKTLLLRTRVALSRVLPRAQERYAVRTPLSPAVVSSSPSSCPSSHLRTFSAAPPPPSEPAALQAASSGSYESQMYDAWCQDPASVHPSWDSYFRGAGAAAALPDLAGGQGGLGAGGQSDNKVIDAHLAVQGTIRSYQVRGHLAAQIDPLGLNNMDKEKAKNMII